jgi:hypothetical protein
VRVRRFLGTLACAGGTVLAAGCGTQHAGAATGQTVDLAAAVSHTQAQTARIATTISSQVQGMTMSFTETGLFDFASSRGVLAVPSPMSVTEIFLPPTTYVKLPGGATTNGGGLPKGKTWVAVPDGTSGASAMLMLGASGGDPADLLAALTAMSSGVSKIGTATIRGVPVTGFAIKVDPAKATTGILGTDRAGVEALAKAFGTAEIPIDVWVDGQNLVRRERLTLPIPGGSGAPAGSHLVLTTDFYDFGVPVRVTAPPASQVAAEGSQFAVGSGGTNGSGSGSGSVSSSSVVSG